MLMQAIVYVEVISNKRVDHSSPPPPPQRQHHYVAGENAVVISTNAITSLIPNQGNHTSTIPLDRYNPAHSPVYPTIPSKPVKAGLVTTAPLVGETMHFLYDGVAQSNYLDLIVLVYMGVNDTFVVTNATESQTQNISTIPADIQLWIVDGSRVAKFQRHFFWRHLLRSPQIDWKVLIVDFTDQFPFQLRRYNNLGLWEESLYHVRIAVRSIIKGRHYNSQTSRLIPGMVAPNLATAGGPMLHAPYAVRSDILPWIPKERLSNSKLIFDHERPLDVFHPWQISTREGKSKYRNAVSRAIQRWNGTQIRSTTPTGGIHPVLLTTSTEEHGPRRTIGRNSANQVYVQALLSSKIVVVTQKDDWEDHYRFMEALVCGPLVVADTMLAPPQGFLNGTNVIFFSNIDELERYVKYYVSHEAERKAIAIRGWKLAMGRHRAWHRIEELVFGRPLTRVDETII